MKTQKSHSHKPGSLNTDDPQLKENPFQVPDQYFEKFIDTLDLQQNKGRKVHFLPAVRQKVKRYSVAAVLIGLVSVGTILFFMMNKPETGQYSDKLGRIQDTPKRSQVKQPVDTSQKAGVLSVARQTIIPEVKTPAKQNVTNDNSIETLTNEGITDDDIIEYLIDEGFDVIDLSYQP